MIIHKADINDIDEIVNIIDDTKKLFKKEGIPQWQNGYPEKIDFLKDLDLGNLYVVKDNDVVIGTFTLLDFDPNYLYIENGKWLNDTPYVAIHRLAIKELYKRKGVATSIIEYVKSRYNHIRIDTHKLNIPMKNLIVKNGFQYCGIVYMEDKTKRNAYEFAKENVI